MSELGKDNREIVQPSHEIGKPEPAQATEKEKGKLKPNEQGGHIDAESKSGDIENAAHPKLGSAQNLRDARKNDSVFSENQQTAHQKLDSRASHTPQNPEQRNSESQRTMNQDAQRTNTQEDVTSRTSDNRKAKAEGEVQPKPVEDQKLKAQGEVQPKPVEDQKSKAEGEVQPKLVEDQRARLQKEERPDVVDEPRNSLLGESKDEPRDPTLSDRQKQIIDDMIQKGEIDIPESSTEIPKESKLHLPTERTGKFEGEPGNSLFIPSDPNAAERINQYGQPGVEYRNGHPDFKPFCTHDSPWGKIDTEVEIPHMTDQRQNPSYEYGRRPYGSAHDPKYDLGNFAQADNELRDKVNKQYPEANVSSADIEKWRKDNDLVWHELPDGKTMQLVPREIHEGCPHSGGVSNQKLRMAYGNYEPED